MPCHRIVPILPRLKISSVLQLNINLKRRSISRFYNILYSESTSISTQGNQGETSKETQDVPSLKRRKPNDVFFKRMKKKLYWLRFYENVLKDSKGTNKKEAFKLIKSCGCFMIGESRCTRNELARYMWSELEKNGVELDTSLWNTLISVYNDNRFDFEPLEFLREMWDKSNSEPNHSTYALLAQAYALKGDTYGAMKIADFVVQTNKKISKDIYKWLIVAYAKSGDIDGVKMTLDEMKKNGSNPDLDIYGQLLNVHSERGDMDSVDKMIQEMRENGFIPTIQTYLGILENLSINGHSDLIEKAFEQMDDIEKIRQDIYSLILQCVSQGEYKSALILLKNSTKMKNIKSYWFYLERKLFQMLRDSEKDSNEYMEISTMMEHYLNEPELSRFYNVMSFLTSNGQVDDALNILKTFLADGKPILSKHFHPILQNLADGKKIPEIVDIYKLMLDKGIEMDYNCYKFVRHGHGEPESDEFKLFLELIKNDDRIWLHNSSFAHLIKSDNITLNQLVNASASSQKCDLLNYARDLRNQLLSNFEVEEGLSLISAHHEKGYDGVGFIIEEIISKLLKEDRYKDAFAFLSGLLKKDIKIRSFSYTQMLKYLQINERSEEFFDLIRLMNTCGVEPDPHQYYQIIKMASKVGKSSFAQSSFEKLIMSGMFDDVERELYIDLIVAFYKDRECVKNVKGGSLKCAMNIINFFEQMIGKGHSPTNHVIAVVIKSHLDANDVDGGIKMVEKYNSTNRDFNCFLIRELVDRKIFDKAVSLFDKMKEQVQQEQLIILYNEMLRITSFTGDVDKMDKLYQEMIDNGVLSDVQTYTFRIYTYLNAREPEACINIIQEAVEDYSLPTKVFRCTINNLVPTGNVENVQKVVDLAMEYGHEKYLYPNELEMARIMVNVEAGNIKDPYSI